MWNQTPTQNHKTVPPFFSASLLCGFTLIELLVVIGIIALVATFAVPAVTGIMGGSNITQAADMVVGQLRYASQVALTQNRPVEVRFYQYPDKNIPGATNAIRAMQLWQLNTSGTRTALGRVQRFPGTIIISASTNLTSIPTIGNSSSLPSSEITPSIIESLPSGVTSYTYTSFKFRPDGSTTLNSGNNFLTVVNENTPGNPPTNFVTIQIEPATGAIRLYRP